ncbi:nicotinamide-nucleotide amidase [Sphingobacterium allocomposti]|uniref:CinA-like protein n=1 Tax=Sphingobacterium allocomposti TaxID=415956 RepID=A0A5S5DSI8_9SPHI|nr:competence/damage-inducible protein A [Sphingobacterium composti Yoo et al. 2007 non Ten et al. 2007]TYP97619.1 nicotinamide-nucleotide amidase [Sphingobacterium composti Yoo et al. 2007 non Ten et al. 2007]
MTAEIITIGDEILNGQIVDTNSAWMAQQLAQLHIVVVQITSIPDAAGAIKHALGQAEKRADIILVTGGLGPTKDDVTKEAIAAYFNTTLVRDPAVLAHVENIFERAGYGDMPEINRRQADVLANALVLFNDVGTAPGMSIQQNGKYFAFLPGVPFEMKFLMEHRVLPALRSYQQDTFVHNAYLLTVGIGESHLAREITDIEEQMPAYLKLAYLPGIGSVRLRFTAVGPDLKRLIEETANFVDQVKSRLGKYVVAQADVSFEEVIVHTFKSHQVSVATAESCTGGRISAQITQVAGASAMFNGTVVAYANEAKVELLSVSRSTLEHYGAVSEQTVKEMAEGVKKLFHTDYAIATSGIAGPGGGTAEKPVGTVCIAVVGRRETQVRTYHFRNDRVLNIERTTMAGLTMLWNLFQKEHLTSTE